MASLRGSVKLRHPRRVIAKVSLLISSWRNDSSKENSRYYSIAWDSDQNVSDSDITCLLEENLKMAKKEEKKEQSIK